MGWNGYQPFSRLPVHPVVGVEVTVFFPVAVDSEAVASIDVNGLVGLVFDNDEIDTVVFVVLNRVLDAFLQEVNLYVIVRHQGISPDSKDGRQVFRLACVYHG